MWLIYVAGPLVIAAIIAVIVGAGVFSIVLIPLAVIAVATAAWSAMSARAAGAPGANRRSPVDSVGADDVVAGEGPLPTRYPSDEGRAPTTPEALTDARREQQ